MKWMDRLLYIDGFQDVAWAYFLYGDFWITLPVALSAPAQLVALALEDRGAVAHSQLGSMQVRWEVKGALPWRNTICGSCHTGPVCAYEHGRVVNAALLRRPNLLTPRSSWCLCAACALCACWYCSGSSSSASQPSGAHNGQPSPSAALSACGSSAAAAHKPAVWLKGRPQPLNCHTHPIGCVISTSRTFPLLYPLPPSHRHSVREVVYYFVSLLYVLFILLTWLACMMLAIAHHERPRSITWLASVKVGHGARSYIGGLMKKLAGQGCQGAWLQG